MKFLHNLAKRLESVAFILGFIAGTCVLFIPARYFFAWHALPAPPERAIEMIDANHMGDVTVSTVFNKKFICNIYNEKECWIELGANYEPLDLSATLCSFKDCPNHILQIKTASNASHDIAKVSTKYSLHDDGLIYVKQTGTLGLFGCMGAAFLGGFCALVAFLVK